MYQTLLVETKEGIATITINRPEKLNALNKMVIDELATAIEEVYTNTEIKAAIVTGAGAKAFVAGADITEFSGLDAEGGSELAKRGQEAVFNKIEHCPKPVVAAVNGFALGGGCELAMACHFRLAADGAKFGQPEVNLGLIPGYGGTQRLTQLVGKGKAMELMLTGNSIGAAEAKEIGLVNVVTPPESLLAETTSLLKTIIAKAPVAISKIIALTNMAATGNPAGYLEEIKAFGQLMETGDAKEGAAAFIEKRKPVFKGS